MIKMERLFFGINLHRPDIPNQSAVGTEEYRLAIGTENRFVIV